MFFWIYSRVYQLIKKYVACIFIRRRPLLAVGEGSIRELPERIRLTGIQNVLLVTDKGVMSRGLADQLLSELKALGINPVIYDETGANVTIESIEQAVAVYYDNNCEGIIAFGDGTSIDCAKCVGARIARPKKSIRQMGGFMKVSFRLPPLFAVPTTAGTGSESSASVAAVDIQTRTTYVMVDPALIPHEVFLDPLVTIGLSPKTTAISGICILSCAIEAYISRSNNKETKKYAKEAIKLVFDNIYNAYEDGDDVAARKNLQKASYYCGTAYSRVYAGNVCALSHAIACNYGTAQGLASATILPYVLDDYGRSVYKALAELADVMGIHGSTIEHKAKSFILALRELNKYLGIPGTIEEVAEADISTLADYAYREANPGYPVPRLFSQSDFSSVCERLTGKSGFPGYVGNMAKVNLSTGKITQFMMQKDELADYIGGKGIAAKIIHSELTDRIDALSEENIIVITTSPLNSTKAPSSSRFNISTISPLTGLLVSSSCGGNFGLYLRSAGYDALVITGIAPEKTYIRIDDDGISLLNAEHIWGKSTSQAQAMMGSGGTVAIGVAGENLVRYASVASQDRMAGRGGIGAVFGFKQLKGIVASGKSRLGKMRIAEDDGDFNKKWVSHLRNHPMTGQQLPQLGTAALVRMMQYNELLATRNYSRSQFEGYNDISGETLQEKYLVKNKGCAVCPIQCSRVVYYNGREVRGPELETLCLLGSNLCNSDIENIITLNHLCDEYGIDTISFGGSIGFAMELSEKGLWDNGLSFGKSSMLVDVLGKVAMREGIGDDLANGVRWLSEKYGGREFAMHVKGMELAAYDPRRAQGMGLGYATANRGGCHLNGGYMVAIEGLGLHVNGNTTRGKAAFTVLFQDLLEAVSASGSCLFTTYAMLPAWFIKHPNNYLTRIVNAMLPSLGGLVGFAYNHTGLLGFNLPGTLPYPYALKLITGMRMNIGRFLRAGQRVYNIERLVNVRQGLKDGDTLPDRLKSPLKKMPEQKVVYLNKMLKKYYRIRGWDLHGAPKKRRLKKLGLL